MSLLMKLLSGSYLVVKMYHRFNSRNVPKIVQLFHEKQRLEFIVCEWINFLAAKFSGTYCCATYKYPAPFKFTCSNNTIRQSKPSLTRHISLPASSFSSTQTQFSLQVFYFSCIFRVLITQEVVNMIQSRTKTKNLTTTDYSHLPSLSEDFTLADASLSGDSSSTEFLSTTEELEDTNLDSSPSGNFEQRTTVTQVRPKPTTTSRAQNTAPITTGVTKSTHFQVPKLPKSPNEVHWVSLIIVLCDSRLHVVIIIFQRDFS